jgi:hypothetical protein
MSVSHVWTTTIKVPGLPTLPADAPLTIVGDYSAELEITVPAGSVSVEYDVGIITKTKIVSCVINADKAAMEVFTNAADGTGGQHLSLAANKSLCWNNTMDPVLQPPIITVNITKFYLNNSSTVTATFRASFMMNLP